MHSGCWGNGSCRANSHTMTVGTSLGCAGHAATPWNSAAWSLTSCTVSAMGMGSIAICGLHSALGMSDLHPSQSNLLHAADARGGRFLQAMIDFFHKVCCTWASRHEVIGPHIPEGNPFHPLPKYNANLNRAVCLLYSSASRRGRATS